ncbi:MAG: tandem-95 repeat protein, partial [Rhodospirillales bacterium]
MVELEAIVSTMQPGEWRELPDTQAPWLTRAEHDAIVAAAPPGAAGFWGVQGPGGGILRVFSGAELDPNGYRWFFKGGGHNQYGGNEVYQFSFDTLTWERLTEPSAYDPETTFPYEGPTSRHTYDALAWNPITETLWVGGRSSYVPGSGGSGPVEPGVWELDPNTRTWTFHEDLELPPPMQMTFNPETGRLFGLFGYRQDHHAREYDADGTMVPVDYGRNMGVWDAKAGLLTAKGQMYYFGLGDGQPGRPAILEISAGTSRVLLHEWPQEIRDVEGGAAGIAYDETFDRFVIWGGDNRLWTWSFDDQQVRRFNLEGSAPLEPMGLSTIQDKFVYLPGVDAFAAFAHRDSNVWLLKAPVPEEGVLVDPDAPRATIGDRVFTSVSEALATANDGDTITILPGVWREATTITANDITIEGEGAHLKDATTGGKATLVIQGNNTTIRGLEVSGMSVSDGNGAAIRQEGKNLTLDGVYFHDGQQGILANNGTGTILIENSTFERLGHGGRAHGIYVNKIAELIIRDSQFLSSKGQGHEIKSRAAKTTIENSVVASLDGNDSRLIDIPNGGEIVIRNNVLQMGPNTANNDAIGINLEQRNPNNAHDWPRNSILIEGNIIISDRGGSNDRLLHYRDWEDSGYPAPVLVGNTVVGFSSSQVPSGNAWYANRDAAGLPPYPFLPEAPVADGAAPTANDDEAALPENGAVTIAVLANDAAAGDGPLQVVAVGDPAHGTATLNADSTITYVPDADFYGTDTFVYWVSEGSGAAVGTVTLTVEPGSKVRLSDDSTITGPDEAVTVDVLGNDYHIDGAALTVTELGNPSFGTAVLNDDGTVTYAPNEGFTGTDTFSYTVSDGQGGEATANVEVSVKV